jgi:hypothetical protein
MKIIALTPQSIFYTLVKRQIEEDSGSLGVKKARGARKLENA